MPTTNAKIKQRLQELIPGSTPAPSPQLQELLMGITEVYEMAGRPSYRTLATLTNNMLSPSTISRIFNATKAPRWRNIQSLLTTLGVAQSELRTKWYPMYLRAANKPIENAGAATAPADQSTTCGKCGTRVDDPDVHARFHQRLNRAERLLDALERYSKRSVPAPQIRAQPPRPSR
jgi:hypothetical protein